jgi:hypothetical protein
MIIEHFFVSKGASVDNATNQISIFEIIEDITVQAPALPISIPVNIVGIVRREPTEVGEVVSNFQIRINSPSKLIQTENVRVVIQAVHTRTRIRFITGFAVAEPGMYKFSIVQTDRETNSRSIDSSITFVQQIRN